MRDYPQHYRDYTEEDKQAAIAMFMKKSLTGLRKHQRLLMIQIPIAYKMGKIDALENLQGMYDLATQAVLKKCFKI